MMIRENAVTRSSIFSLQLFTRRFAASNRFKPISTHQSRRISIVRQNDVASGVCSPRPRRTKRLTDEIASALAHDCRAAEDGFRIHGHLVGPIESCGITSCAEVGISTGRLFGTGQTACKQLSGRRWPVRALRRSLAEIRSNGTQPAKRENLLSVPFVQDINQSIAISRKRLVNRGQARSWIISADGRGHFEKLSTRPGDGSMYGTGVFQP